ncbi:hypothetical protein ABZ820_20705 [Streptomyces diacarni]|uniref:Uncharacterized protein n=1 Tax=Streptomyces diacarni TaxID=2800381 RepID=A0A367FCI1_9ACTN|nr:hypothetical protein [Streptomyces diacarni]RCG27562.1 hypothetical protein DTL70_04280 [Streptomyces diacarni]
MVKISRSTKDMVEGAGFSLDPQTAGGEDLVMVFKGSVLRGLPVGKAITALLGQWQAMGHEPRGTTKRLGMFPTLDEALVAVMLHSDSTFGLDDR